MCVDRDASTVAGLPLIAVRTTLSEHCSPSVDEGLTRLNEILVNALNRVMQFLGALSSMHMRSVSLGK